MNRLRAATAVEEIPLEPGIQLSGYGVEDRALTSVHDPLTIKAVALASGETTVALVALDLLNVSLASTRRVRGRLDGEIDAVMLAATHTHAGPYVPTDALEMNPNHRMETDRETLEGIERGVVEAVRNAVARLEPASLRVGRVEHRASAENRRAVGGVIGTIRLPRGEIDPDLLTLELETASGERTVVYHYACHPVCTTAKETMASADWPGVASRLVETREDAVAVFLNGAAGDVNPRDWPADPDHGEAVYEFMEAVGNEVADGVGEALARGRQCDAVTAASITARDLDLALPLKDVPEESALRARISELDAEIDRLDDRGEQTAIRDRRVDRGYVEELLGIARWSENQLQCTLQYLEIGDVGLLGVPGEAFVDHGLDSKSRASVETLVPVGYANGYVGYLPTLRELENGDYEIDTMKVAPEAVTAFRGAAFSLLGADR